MIILSQKQEMNSLYDIIKRLTNERPVTEIKLIAGGKLYVKDKYILIDDILDNVSITNKYITKKELMKQLDEDYVSKKIMQKRKVSPRRIYYYLTNKGLKYKNK